MIRLWLVCLVFFLVLPAQAEVRARLQKDRAYVNDVVQLEISTDDLSADAPDLKLPDGVQLVSRSHGSRRELINGVAKAEQSWRYRLLLTESGQKSFAAVPVGKDKTPALSLLVLEAAEHSPRSGSDDVLFEIDTQPKQAVVGEQVRVVQRILRQVPMRFARLGQLNAGDAAEMVPVEEDVALETERGGRRYHAVERSVLLFPNREGPLTLPAVAFEADVQRSEAGATLSALDIAEPLRLTARPELVEVAAAPGAVPARELQLNAQIDPAPEHFRVGEPFTLVLSLQARDQRLAALPALQLPEDPAFRVYPDKVQEVQEASHEGLKSIRQQRVALIPHRAGELAVPQIRLRWFNTQTRQIEDAVSPALSISVLPAAPGAAAPAAPVFAKKPAPETRTTPDPEPADADTDSAEAGPAILTNTRLPWLLAGVFALGWLLTALWFWRRKLARTGTAATTAVTEPTRPAKAHWQALEAACRADQPEAARHALNAWLETQPQMPSVTDPQLADALRALDAALYGPPPRQWHGAALLAALPALAAHYQPKKARDDALTAAIFP